MPKDNSAEGNNEVPIVIALSILFVVAFPANLFIVLRSILCCRKVENNFFIFLFGLAISDLLVTMFIIPWLIAFYVIIAIDWTVLLENSQYYCKFQEFLFQVFFAISLVILTLLATGNFFSAYKTEIYNKLMTSKLVYRLLAATWVSLGNHF